MADNYQSYLQGVAAMRQERAQRERLNQLEYTQAEYREAVRERNAAAARGDWQEFELRDNDCIMHEQQWQSLNPPRPPQMDPRAVEWLNRRKAFRERHGQAADQAIQMAHNYATAPRTANPTAASVGAGQHGMGLTPNTPQYFEAIDNLLTMYAKDYGLRYDPEELALTPTEAAKASGLSATQDNAGLRAVSAAGRLGQKR